MARSEVCYSVNEYMELKSELEARDNVESINVVNYSDYSGVEIHVDWIEY